MTTYVALLRGINVGGNNKVEMKSRKYNLLQSYKNMTGRNVNTLRKVKELMAKK